MKRILIVVISTLLLSSLSAPLYGDEEGFSGTFENRPITKGICEETAYTLNRGEWKAGNLSLPGGLHWWRNLYLQYGLSDSLQIGTALSQNFLGRPNLLAKYHLPFGGPGEAELAIPASISLNIYPLGVSTNTGLTASWNLNSRLGFHTGVNFRVISYYYSFFNSSAYLMADYDLFSNMKLISEFDFYSFGENFFTARLGGLVRILKFINLRVRSSLQLPLVEFQAGADLFVRF